MSSLPQPPPTTHPSIKLPKILGGEIALSQLKELSQEVVREEGQVSMCALVYYAICLVFLGNGLSGMTTRSGKSAFPYKRKRRESGTKAKRAREKLLIWCAIKRYRDMI